MSALVRFLARFCADHPLDEKIFVCPSFVVGRQIGEALARESGSWVNLRFMTLPSLAQERAALELARRGVRLVAGPELPVFVDGLFRELQEAKRLEYFGELTPSPGVAQALLRAIGRLRLEGLASGRIDPSLFTVPAKGRDLSALSALYEDRLRAAGAIDLAGLYALARAAAGRDQEAGRVQVLLSADTALARLEREFLDAASGGRPVFCGGDPVFGLERPRRFETAKETAPGPSAGTDAARLPWLFDPERKGAPKPFGDGTVAIFRALGRTNECREVLRRVLAGGLAFDEVEIVVPPGPAYATAFYRLSLRAGVPVTFADGLPLSLSSPGRALDALLEWIEQGFTVSTLCRLVASLDLRLPFGGPGEDLPPETVSRYLRQAQIGWGRARYPGRLDALRKAKEEDAERPAYEDVEDSSEDKRRDARHAAADIARLTDAVGRLLDSIPDLPRTGPVPAGDLCLGLAKILESSTALRPDPEERDAQALRLVTAALRDLAEGSGPLAGPVPAIGFEAAFDRIRTAVASLAVGASAPRPGHLHVSSHAGGGYSGRPVTFILGLDDSGFPGRGLQDPILLDAEREKLSPGLPTNADSLKENVHAMAALLASLRGRVVVGYPSYDLLEDRASFPSSLILQVHRLLRGDRTRDYADLDMSLAGAAGFLPSPDTAVDETEWWLGRLAGDCRPEGGLAAVRRHFPGLAGGIQAEEARAGDKLGPYEGIVRIDRTRFDPLVNRGLELSASRLERLVKCPFSYFLRYVLGIEPPEELERDLSRWLEAKDRGSLIHEILCAFMTRLAEAGEKADPDRHVGLMRAIAEEIIAGWADKIPPPSPGIFESERRDIDHALSLFLAVEGARPATVHPLAFEKRFSGVPIEIAGGRSFLLKGVIDRIDEIGPSTFRILDYKTGSPKHYQDLVAFGQGRIIQHALYAVAAETILVDEGLARDARIAESGYFFPTRRGEGGEVIIRDFDRGAFRVLLAHILSLISKGYFPTALKEECRYCDYGPVCGGTPETTKRKIQADPEVGEALKRLKAYA